MSIKDESIPVMRLKESLILMKFYRDQEMKAMRNKLNECRQRVNQIENQITNSKSQNWCTVCHNLAQFYCCLRFYCSKDCQTRDWIGGHHNEGLLFESRSKRFRNIFLNF